MVKLGFGFAAVVLAGTMVAAQDIDRRSQTKVSVEDGKRVTVTGCLDRTADGSYMLTHVTGKEGAIGSYLLAADNHGDELERHVRHRVEITGIAADKGDGRIKVETKNETRVADGDKTRTESKSELRGDLRGVPYLGIKSMKMLATICP